MNGHEDVVEVVCNTACKRAQGFHAGCLLELGLHLLSFRDVADNTMGAQILLGCGLVFLFVYSPLISIPQLNASLDDTIFHCH